MKRLPPSTRSIPTVLAAVTAVGLALAACGRSGLDADAIYGASEGSSAGGGGSGAGSSGTQSGPTTNSSGTMSSSNSGSGSGTGAGSSSSSTGTGGSNCDKDKDGFDSETCGGGDCNDLNPEVFPGHVEVCTDGSDNDCNGVADCFDPACQGGVDCGCDPSPENCSNGKDDDCDTIADCFDSDCLGTPACGCAPSEAGQCVNGFDDDCDGNIDCNDSDCFADPTCQCKAIQEDCGNGEDDDCDLLIDCADPDCNGLFPCVCQPPGTPEVCNDQFDNDCDGLLDCADPDCLVSPSCQMCTAEICDDGKDNNCDGKIDCADPACNFAPNCAPTQEICNNGLDDDNDTLIDCSDPDCASNPICILKQSNCLTAKLIPGSGTYTGDTTGNIGENNGTCGGGAGEAVFYFVLDQAAKVHLDTIGSNFDSTIYVRKGSCENGKEMGCDDDSAGSQWAAKLEFGYQDPNPPTKGNPILFPGTYFVFVDGYTIDQNQGPNEGFFNLNVEIIPNPPEICNDGWDNDGDVYVDCADSTCTFVGMCATCLLGGPAEPEFGVAACTDGLDNDCDGNIDGDDQDCHASDVYITEFCNGFDENDNGIIDDFSCRCAVDAECQFGQICYSHTAHACGPPCDQFFGTICPSVAAGSFCNLSTQQCEF